MISYQRPPADLREWPHPLPLAPLSEIFSASLHPSAPAPVRSTQLTLADDVRSALVELNVLLSKAHTEIVRDVARSVEFNDRTVEGCEQTALRLVNQLCKLYAIELGHPGGTVIPNLTECVRVVVEHLRKVADALATTGYSNMSINVARDGFAAEPHLHKFFTYLLYAGREQGTQVFEGHSVLPQLAIRDNTVNRNDRTVYPEVPDLLLQVCPISDVKNGLLLPPGVTHRAVPSECFVSVAEANLVIALMAFKPAG